MDYILFRQESGDMPCGRFFDSAVVKKVLEIIFVFENAGLGAQKGDMVS
ncbi:MAG: hypothetical protein IJB29_06840 [Mailhella sp.]|nr:hypothetical protein [Mailhella sp.]